MIIVFVCPELFRLVFMTTLTTATKYQSLLNIVNEIISCLSCIFQFTTQFIVLSEFRQQFYCFMKCQKVPSRQRNVLHIRSLKIISLIDRGMDTVCKTYRVEQIRCHSKSDRLRKKSDVKVLLVLMVSNQDQGSTDQNRSVQDEFVIAPSPKIFRPN